MNPKFARFTSTKVQILTLTLVAAARLNLHANDIFDAVDLSKSGALEIGELKSLFHLFGVSLLLTYADVC